MGAPREDDLTGLTLERDGAQHFGVALTAEDLAAVAALVDEEVGTAPGARLQPAGHTANLLHTGAPWRIAAVLTSERARPVRAVAFDKTPDANWAVAWHQDRTICVREQHEVDGFGPWSRKSGRLHVTPPWSVLSRLITLRLHVDRVGGGNAPLEVAIGSHQFGQVAASDAARLAGGAPKHICLASAGDIWAYSTPILHRSAASATLGRRRVLQVDYADFDLPHPLRWSGIG